MAVVKINAIEVDPARGPELEQRFAQRASEVEKMPGFLGFELLRPTENETRYFVYTRWETEEAFQAWVQSEAFQRGHAHASADRGAAKPVAHGSSVLGFDVVISVDAAASTPAA
ncbi:antibiotic biosynthesis monooxygenase family protein [Patulibacter sp. S7RM1-6]